MNTISLPVDECLGTDVLVIGGGLAAICAAIQAARLGCEVILVEKDPVLGGNSGPLLGVHPSGAHSFHPYASETGIIGEIEEDAAREHCKIYTWGRHYNIAQQWDSLLHRKLTEAGVRVFRRTYAHLPVMEGARIAAVVAQDLARLKTLRFDVRVAVIDGSGDGNLSAAAGAGFRHGREARSEFGERSAPDAADRVTLGTSLTALVRKGTRPSKFVPPPGTPPYEPGYGFAGKDLVHCLNAHSSWSKDDEFCFLWHTETGGQGDTIEDDHAIYEELLRQIYSVWHHIKNEAHVDEASHWELVWVSPKAGKRESRRFVGDHLLTQTEVENAAAFPDAVGYGGYSVDIHNPSGARNTQVEIVFYSIPPLWSIPYRSLYSRNVENLFLAGRLASVTHLGLGSFRLQKTLATAGQAAGAAAAICRRRGCTPRRVCEEHLEELQQTLLREDATILTVPNRDPEDLARRAAVTASSEWRHGVEHPTDWLPLDRPRGVLLWDWAPRLDAAELLLMNPGDAPAAVSLTLTRFRPEQPWKDSHERRRFPYVPVHNRAEWGVDHTPSRFLPAARAEARLPAHFAGWVRFAPNAEMSPKDPTSDQERYLLVVDPASGVSWARHDRYHDFARRCWLDAGEAEYRTAADAPCFRLEPAPAYGEAANATNGWNRRFATNPVNAWISHPEARLPQWLQLSWPAPVTFSRVHLAFDTLTRAYQEMPFNRGEEVSPMCVRAYRLEARVGGAWQTLAAVADNHNRRRVHTFAPVAAAALRLTVEDVWDAACGARVYEVRAYR